MASATSFRSRLRKVSAEPLRNLTPLLNLFLVGKSQKPARRRHFPAGSPRGIELGGCGVRSGIADAVRSVDYASDGDNGL